MGILTGMVWGTLTEQSHPAPNPNTCINCHRRHNCTACADICPHQVMQPGGKAEQWSGCTNCGRCAAACPTRAIALSEQSLRRLYALRTGEEERLWLGCERSEREQDERLSCLCGLPWEALAWLSFTRILILDLSPCEGCEQEPCKALLGEQLGQLHFFLGPDRFAQRVHLVCDTDTEPKPSQQMDRRELFQYGAQWAKQGARSLLRQAPLLGSEELKLDGVSLRSLLHRELKERGGTCQWHIPNLSGDCIGCGACVQRCPSAALSLTEDTLLLDTRRCTACGGCAAACSHRCFSGTRGVVLASLAPLKLGTVTRLRCKACGAEMKGKTHNGLCPACSRKRMNEALRRAGT